MTGVVFSQVCKQFPATGGVPSGLAVRDLSLTIAPGEMLTILGPSGCGKTTTLRMLAGFELPSRGSITIDGRDVTNVPVNVRNVGMVFQSYALFPHMTVRQNVEYGIRLAKLPREEMVRRVDDVLETMALTAYADRAPSRLSGGQQQRVALARAVVTRPKVLLFDEPLSNLDAQLRERMRDELRAIQLKLNITSLYVTHDQSEAMAISDRVVVMRDGRIEQVDTPRNVYARPGTAFVAEFMGKANILPGEVVAAAPGWAQVRLAGEVFDLTDGGRARRVGEKVRCVVRPEYLRIDPDGSLEATVQRVIFLGGHVEYLVRIGGQDCAITDARYAHSGIAEAGQTLRVALDAAPVWILPDEPHNLQEEDA